MKNKTIQFPEYLRGLIPQIQKAAVRAGGSAYLVGGCVRDIMLGIKNYDTDITFVGDGVQFAHYLHELLMGKLIIHRHFQTATLHLESGLKIDIATARSEVYPASGSLPVVSAGSLRDDLFRRDFTINAMAASLNREDCGLVVDEFAGMSDLDKGLIRVLHDQSFIDDATRILRAIRFSTRFKFRIEPHSRKLLEKAAKVGVLEKMQPQRVRDEFVLCLKECDPVSLLRRVDELAGFHFLDSRISFQKVSRLLADIQKSIQWFSRVHPSKRGLEVWVLYCAGLVSQLSLSRIKRIIGRLVLSKGDEKRILSFKIVSASVSKRLKKDQLKASSIFDMLEPLSYETIVMVYALNYNSRLVKMRISHFFTRYNGCRIHLKGDDLVRLGSKPGPDFTRIFKKILEHRLDGKVSTKEEELKLARKLLTH